MKKYMNTFFFDSKGESGAELIEYAVVIGIVAGLVTAFVALSNVAKTGIGNVQSTLEGALTNANGS